jgi:two-component system cell cycle sensor histidine kinase/response regulator CckA
LLEPTPEVPGAEVVRALTDASFLTVAEAASDAIFASGLDGTIVSWNPAAQRLYGYTADEAVGCPVAMLHADPPDGADHAGDGTPEASEARRRRRDGSLIHVSASVSPLRDRAGDVVGRIAIERDVTARIREEVAARLSALRYRMPVGQLPDAAIYEYDGDGRIRMAEGPLLALHGRSADDLVGKTIWELLPEDGAATFDRHFRLALSGTPHTFELENPSGATFTIDIVPLPDQHGRPVGAIAFARDISARKEVERGMHFEAQLLDSLEVAVVAADREGRVTHWNRQAEVFYERPRDRAIGRLLSELNPAYGMADPTELLERLLDDEVNRQEHLIRRGDGTTMNVFITGSALRDAAGQVVGFVGVGVDITRARAVADELHRARSLFKAAFDNAPVGMAVVRVGGPDAGAVVWVNPALCEMLSTEEGRLLGRPCWQSIHPEDVPAFDPVVEQFRAGSDAAFEKGVRFRTSTGRLVWGDVSASLIRDVEGAPRHAVALIRDVTAARDSEAVKEGLEARLHQSQKLDAIGRLAGGIAHDFNNLLQLILNYADLALAELGDADPVGEDVQEVRMAAERAAALTRQLLVFARREVGQPQALDLAEILQDTQSLLHRTLGEDVELVTVVEPELWPVCVDRSQLEQVLMNLAINARDAMPAGGLLRIAIDNVHITGGGDEEGSMPPGEYVHLLVADDGVGMSAGTAEHAFEPFFTTKAPGDGTGLGLATVYGIVIEAGGQIDLASELGRGTRVDLWLPASRGAAPEAPSQESPGAPAGRGERVLVVEDEHAVRALATRMLTAGGYDVVEAGGAVDALAVAAAHPPDVLLADVVMPGMSGSTLAEELRSRHPELAVVMVSGYTDDVTMRHGLAGRRGLFLEKPYTQPALLHAVRDALDQAGAPAPQSSSS